MLTEKEKKYRRLKIKEWRKNSPLNTYEYRRNWQLKVNFGITLSEYNTLFALQYGKCAICKRHQSELKQTLHVDHCHKTKKVRGLLCVACNQGIGHFKDNPEILLQAINYLHDA